ncbi:MAG: hypothetical protein ABUL60_24430 [Myxococcales bacterium]
MTDSGRNISRSLEAAYWRVLRKQVRADNIMSGARETFVERLKRNYLGGNGAGPTALPDVPRAAPAVPAPRVKERPLVKAPAEAPEALEAKAKARLPLPFYGIEQQSFRDREVIFTCVVGDRHFLAEPHATTGYEHVLYVDRDLNFEAWNQRPLLFWDAAPKLITLFHKYSLSALVAEGTKMLWVDSRVEITAEVARNIFASLDNSDLCLFKHYERDCVYDEMLAVLEAKRSSAAQCEEYARLLREQSFPRNRGLFETGVMGFRICPEVIALFRKVFGLCYRYASRDQLALPVALAGSGVSFHLYDGGETNLRSAEGVTVKSWKDLPK